MSSQSAGRQLVWLWGACDCPLPPSRGGKKGFRPDPDCFHGLLSVVRIFQSGKYLVENSSGFVAAFRVSDLIFDVL